MKLIGICLTLLAFAFSGQAREALIFSGGWPGHKPLDAALYMKAALEEQGFTVTATESLECLDDADALKKYDLIIPNWTMGKITEAQSHNLAEAVKAGSGLAGVHGGMGDAFRKMTEYEELVGGHFKSHPYRGPYSVEVQCADHPVMQGVPASFDYSSEKYFMIMDSEVTVLADTDYSSVTPGLRMPVIWVKNYGKGRVFYSALGHNVPVEYKKFPEARQVLINGCLWASRQSIK